MAFTFFSLNVVLCLVAFVGCATAQLNPNFYRNTCPNVSRIVQQVVHQALRADSRIAASLLHLHFHDCFVDGCDASVLLDTTANFTGEWTNTTVLRGFGVIDNIKAAVEHACRGTVSCADILAIAVERSIALSGGPSWTVQLGRRDSTTANPTLAKTAFPAPNASVYANLKKFQNLGLSLTDLVTLSGAHTIGRAHCRTFIYRLNNFNGTGNPDPTLKSSYRSTLQRICLQDGNGSSITSFDPGTPNTFDNNYFVNLQKNIGLLQSDQELLSMAASSTISIVNDYSRSQADFFSNFSNSMIKMGNLSPLTGTSGEIRLNCGKVNG